MTQKRKIKFVFIIFICICIIVTYKLDWKNMLTVINQYPIEIKAIVIILLQALQIVIAFLPGEPIELFSGYAFGSWLGTFICLLGSLIGTFVVYLLVQKYGEKVIQFFFKEENINEFKNMMTKKHHQYFLYGLYCIPGVPKDIMTYMMSIFPGSLFKWLSFTTIARIPSIVTSTFITGSIKNQQYHLAIIIFLVTIVLVSIGYIYWRKVKS